MWLVAETATAEAELVPREPCADWNCESNGGSMHPQAWSGHRIHALPKDLRSLLSRIGRASQRQLHRPHDAAVWRSRATTFVVHSIGEKQRS